MRRGEIDTRPKIGVTILSGLPPEPEWVRFDHKVDQVYRVC